jgi:hypothetical protein
VFSVTFSPGEKVLTNVRLCSSKPKAAPAQKKQILSSWLHPISTPAASRIGKNRSFHMRAAIFSLLVIGLSACATPSDVAPAQTGYRPAVDFSTWADVVAGPKTQVLTLGSTHIGQIQGGFDTANLSLVLDRLAAFNPTIITHEGLSGEQCMVVRENPTIYPGIFDNYCWGEDEARAALSLSFQAARAEVESSLANWPASPTPAERRRLAALMIAAGDRPSAILQWLYLPETERKVGDLVDEKMLPILNRASGKKNETLDIGVMLALRLGLQRIYPVDDHTSDAVYVPGGSALEAAILAHWQRERTGSTSVIDRYQEMSKDLSSPQSVLSFFRFMNAPATQQAFVEDDFRDALKIGGPGYYGRVYVAWYEIRNLRMVANIRAAVGPYPGARVLNIVGASHKAYYDRYLSQMSDIELIDAEILLKE